MPVREPVESPGLEKTECLGKWTMDLETRISDLLRTWQERRLHKEAVDLEDLCADTPDVLDELARRIRVLEGMDPGQSVTPAWDVPTTPPAAQRERPETPPTVPGYEVLSKLGEGGMGVVYKVRNLTMGRVEALKMVRPLLAPTPQVSQRFQKEIHATAQLEDPRIVRIYAAGEHEGQPYYTMEFIPGGSLARQMDRFHNDPRAAASLLARVAWAVDFLHTKNIIHRDLKPGNILLKEDEPLVSDFGLARCFDEQFDASGSASAGAGSHLTQTGELMGTLVYMSPEQAAGQTGKLTPASDVWALGVMLYELLTGRRPFVDSTHELIREHIQTAEPARPRTVQPQVNPDLEAICLRCLEKDATRRYRSAAELADHLERWLRGEPILPERWPRRLWRTTRRHPTLAVAAALLMIFVPVLAIVAWTVLHPDSTKGARLASENRGKILAALRTGRTVELIPATGPPTWFDWARKDALDTATDAAGKPFAVHGDDLALVELAPRCPRRFRLRVQVHHDGGDRNGDVGVYFAYSKKATAKGLPVDGFCGLVFNDVAPMPGKEVSMVRASVYLVIPSDTDRYAIRTARLADSTFKPAGLPAVEPWRTLEVVMSPSKLNMTWDGVPLKEVPRAEFDRMADFLLTHSPVRPKDDPRFQTDEALGLFVRRGTAWFRSCTLEPLPDE
jgi:serine/threonine-protein kinase